MSTHWREERCPDCGALRNVEYAERTVPSDTPTPTGWHVTRRGATWTRIERATGWTEVCDCDVAGELS